MKLTFKQTALTLALAGSLSLTGCNFIGDGDSVFTAAPLDVVTIDGTASKGALENATVVACEVDTACETAAVAAFGANNPAGTLAYKADGTDANGLYTLDVSVDADKAVIVRVLADANTTQECDYDGCVADDVADIELKTVTFVETDTPTVKAPVNVLSTIATETFKSLKSDDSYTSKADFNTSKKSASDSVAALLGLDASVLNGTQEDLFTAVIPSATAIPGAASDNLKKLAIINASFGGLKDADTKLSAAIKAVSTNVATVVKPDVVGGKVTVDTSSISTAFNKLSSAISTTKTFTNVTIEVEVPDGEGIKTSIKEAIVNTGAEVTIDDITATGSTGTTGTTGGTN